MKEALLPGMVLMGRDTESLLQVSWVICTYARSLIISRLALQDVGWYMCTGTITGDMNWRSLAVTTTISAQYVNNQLVMELYISI